MPLVRMFWNWSSPVRLTIPFRLAKNSQPADSMSRMLRSVWTFSPSLRRGRRLITAFPFECRLPSGSS